MKKKIRVLVVDDSAVVRQALTEILESDPGIEVMATASDPFVAVERIEREVPDVITLDVEMPRMDGLALCRAIRATKRFRELPVVLITALETPGDRARGLEAGADAYLGKSSFDQQALLETIRELVG